MENSFKVGDIVKILPKDDSTNYLPSYVNSMRRYAGQLATITNINEQSCQINLDRGVYYWPIKALQLVTSETVQTNVSLANTCPNTISAQTVNVSSLQNSIQRTNDVTNLPKCTQEEPQTETELNLFPTKKHYQLNFDTY